LISINGLVDLVCDVAYKQLAKNHDPSKPQGVRGRNSDNARLREVLKGELSISLEESSAIMYTWIERELTRRNESRSKSPHVCSREPTSQLQLQTY
jgi:hypothetical protein